jgi:hypothetical protein
MTTFRMLFSNDTPLRVFIIFTVLMLLTMFIASAVHIVKRRGENTFDLTLTCKSHELKKGDRVKLRTAGFTEVLEAEFVVRKIVDSTRIKVSVPTFFDQAIEACRSYQLFSYFSNLTAKLSTTTASFML